MSSRPEQSFKPESQNVSGLSDKDMHSPLVQEWMKAQQEVYRRDKSDNGKDADAAKSDQDAINLRTGKPSKADRIADDKQDAKGDVEAAGYTGKNGKFVRGDDQKNAAQDSALKKLDQEMLAKFGNKLNPEVVKGLQAQEAGLDKTIQNSRGDVKDEVAYFKGDRAEQKALRSGTPAEQEAANAAQIALRKRDQGNESKYIADNNNVMGSTSDIMKQFGYVTIDGKGH